jgi:hypothetical protein
LFIQKITPNPLGPTAEEGMCLQYVRQTFGLPARYGSATEAWNNSPSQHRDRNYPKGVWFAVWWELDKNVNGHVALVAPDGRVYSTSNLNPNPLKVHPNVADVEAYYARYGFTLTYRGWTEDVAGTPVIEQEEEDMPLTDADIDKLLNREVTRQGGMKGSTSLKGLVGYMDTNLGRIINAQAAQDAQIKGLIGAIAALSKGEKFDEAKLLAGVQSAAAAGVKAAVESIDTTVTFKG